MPAEKEKEIVILLLGATRSGKTTFARQAVEQNGASTTSTTNNCMDYQFTMHDRKIVLIDTPGFCRSQSDNMDVLRKIAKRIRRDDSQEVSGVILFHSIAEGWPRLWSLRRHMDVFKEICGDCFLAQTVFLTTMWDRIDSEEYDEADDMQKQLQHEFEWLAANQFAKFHGDNNSAKAVIDSFVRLDLTNPPRLLFAHEMKTSKWGRVDKTSAGKVIALQTNREVCVVQ